MKQCLSSLLFSQPHCAVVKGADLQNAELRFQSWLISPLATRKQTRLLLSPQSYDCKSDHLIEHYTSIYSSVHFPLGACFPHCLRLILVRFSGFATQMNRRSQVPKSKASGCGYSFKFMMNKISTIYLSEPSLVVTFAYNTSTSEGSSFMHSTPLSSTTTG